MKGLKTGGRQPGSLNKTTAARNARLRRDEQLTAGHALQNLSTIANTQPKAFTGADVIKANELILKVHGALNDKHTEARVTVNIGFLVSDGTVQVLAPTPQVMVLDAVRE